jgi:type IV secretory pathway ATPase VirB11/archaellum biosynthesis ATPase
LQLEKKFSVATPPATIKKISITTLVATEKISVTTLVATRKNILVSTPFATRKTSQLKPWL